MPPTIKNGKICYVEIPATDIQKSMRFYKRFSAGRSESGVTALSPLMIPSAR